MEDTTLVLDMCYVKMARWHNAIAHFDHHCPQPRLVVQMLSPHFQFICSLAQYRHRWTPCVYKNFVITEHQRGAAYQDFQSADEASV